MVHFRTSSYDVFLLVRHLWTDNTTKLIHGPGIQNGPLSVAFFLFFSMKIYRFETKVNHTTYIMTNVVVNRDKHLNIFCTDRVVF